MTNLDMLVSLAPSERFQVAVRAWKGSSRRLLSICPQTSELSVASTREYACTLIKINLLSRILTSLLTRPNSNFTDSEV